jgi:hypothetical protein
MQKVKSKIKDALIVLFAFSFPLMNVGFLGWNIMTYYQQQRSYKRIIEAWRKQDKSIAEKARLYDIEHAKEPEPGKQGHSYCGFYYQPVVNDSPAITVQFQY